jgi:chromatin remodeling complex protein RSC6
MSKQTKSSVSKDVKEVQTPVAVATPVVEEPQKASRKKKAESAPVPVPTPAPEPVSADAAVAASADTAVGEADEHVVTKRRQVTRDDVEKDFDALLQSLDEEIETIRKNDDKNKSKGVRFLRSVYKKVRQLRTDSLRVASKKVRRVSSSSATVNSGFMKPVKISKDMQKFTGLKEDQLVSRVEVTKSICQYVKEKNLQNQADRRQFTPDEKLAKLLGTDKPLTYYALQQQIQPHFIK